MLADLFVKPLGFFFKDLGFVFCFFFLFGVREGGKGYFDGTQLACTLIIFLWIKEDVHPFSLIVYL